jgi:hypothetical protein
MNYKQLKSLARRVDLAVGEERKQLVEKLIKELPKLDPLEGFSEGAVWLAKLIAKVKWFDASEFS